ncbi:MAG: hypothetical protein SF069_03735 [Phycisphaerae bacterium]|nr:hypothetical protein [Phycisphaerae bacterium]
MKKWITLSALLAGATVFQNGCLSAFWNGFFNGGFPGENRVVNVALDVLQEELFG